jgi:hypothetical protein
MGQSLTKPSSWPVTHTPVVKADSSAKDAISERRSRIVCNSFIERLQMRIVLSTDAVMSHGVISRSMRAAAAASAAAACWLLVPP